MKFWKKVKRQELGLLNARGELSLICLYPSLSFAIYFIINDKFKIMIWDKVGFVLASKQRTEVFRLAIENQTIEEIESKVRETKNVKRILKDFEREGLIKIEKEKIELTELGKQVAEKIPRTLL